MTSFLAELPPDPALIALLETVIHGDEHETHKRCGALIRRAKALGWVRDSLAVSDVGRTLLPTPEGLDVFKRWGAA